MLLNNVRDIILSLCTKCTCASSYAISRIGRPLRTVAGLRVQRLAREVDIAAVDGPGDAACLCDIRDARYVDAYTQDSGRYTSVHYRNGARDANVTSIMRQ